MSIHTETMPSAAQPKYTIIRDTREKPRTAWVFSDAVDMIDKKLDTGDYSIIGLTNEIALERKAPDDFLGSITQGRKRFFREIERLSVIPYSCIVVEESWEYYAERRYTQRVSVNAIRGTLERIVKQYGVPVYFLPSRQDAICFAERWLIDKVTCISALPHFLPLPRFAGGTAARQIASDCSFTYRRTYPS